ncbi:hypothetical protein IAD21_04646 [Abditibacteriota bacterium]|nr:hypothetical protein IAD21_04646 [Abditibacteriota bacterium]
MKFLSLVALLTISSAPAFAQTYAKGTRVGGVSIAGLSQAAATRRLKRQLAPRLEHKITLASGTKAVYRRRRDLGFSLDVGQMLAHAKKDKVVSIAFRVDAHVVGRAMKRIAPELSTKPRDARPIYFRRRVQIRPEIIGKKLNFSTSAARLRILGAKNPTQTRFSLAETAIKPKTTRADLKGINAILSTYTTRFNPGNIKRTLNMRVALRHIDGKIVARGQTFSLNDTVGERTQARGFRTAIIFEDGKKKPGIGGGVSQITGTLFNAALEAGLPIVTYRTHSRPVAYISLGRDATVAWGGFDNKWKNDTGAPIFISYKIKGDRLTATLFGKRTGRTTKIRVTSKHLGPRDIKANLYRVIYKNGKVQKSGKVGSSHYNWKADDAD